MAGISTLISAVANLFDLLYIFHHVTLQNEGISQKNCTRLLEKLYSESVGRKLELNSYIPPKGNYLSNLIVHLFNCYSRRVLGLRQRQCRDSEQIRLTGCWTKEGVGIRGLLATAQS